MANQNAAAIKKAAEALAKILKAILKFNTSLLGEIVGAFAAASIPLNLDGQEKKIEEAGKRLQACHDINTEAVEEILSLSKSLDDNLRDLTQEELNQKLGTLQRNVKEIVDKSVDKAAESFTMKSDLREVIMAKFKITDEHEADLDAMSVYIDDKGDVYIGKKEGYDFDVAKLDIEENNLGEKTLVLGDIKDGNSFAALHEQSFKKEMPIQKKAVSALVTASKSVQDIYHQLEEFRDFKKNYETPKKSLKEKTVAKYCKEDDTFRIFNPSMKTMVVIRHESDNVIQAYAINTKNFPQSYELGSGNEVPKIDFDNPAVKMIAQWEGKGEMINVRKDTSIFYNPKMKHIGQMLNGKQASEYLKHFGIDQEAVQKKLDDLTKDHTKSIGVGKKISKAEYISNVEKFTDAISRQIEEAGYGKPEIGKPQEDSVVVTLENKSTIVFDLGRQGLPHQFNYTTEKGHSVAAFSDGGMIKGGLARDEYRAFNQVRKAIEQATLETKQGVKSVNLNKSEKTEKIAERA